MHTLEPFYNWRNFYVASEDPLSPFFEREYNEFQYHEKVYDHYIHPQWDNIGSSTLFAKVIFVDYSDRVAVIELLGEWNDCLHNDIMIFKREIIEHMMLHGIVKFILIGENVLNFHSSDDCYYEEWFEEVDDEDGWIALVNFLPHVLDDLKDANIDSYFVLGGKLDDLAWRTQSPMHLTSKISDMVMKRLGPVT